MLLAELYGDIPGAEDESLARERSYLRAHLKCFDDFDMALSRKMKEAIAAQPIEASLVPLFADPRWKTFVGKLMALNLILKGAHHILHKVDEVSAPFGMLPRAPLFDERVADVAFRAPPQLKLKGSVEKYLLKRAVEDTLPREIMSGPRAACSCPSRAGSKDHCCHRHASGCWTGSSGGSCSTARGWSACCPASWAACARATG